MALLEAIRTYVGYSCAMNRQVWDSVMQLTDAQFVADIPHSHGSIRNQMVHIAHTEAGWLRGLQDDPNARGTRPAPTEYPTRAAAFALCEEKSHALEAYVAGLDETALARVPAGMDGPVWQVLLHLVNHSTDHRAQVLRALHDFGAPTFDQDFILWLWRA